MPELHVSKDDVKSALDRVSGAIVSSGSHPAFECFFFQVSPSGSSVTAANRACMLTTGCSVESESSFSFLVPASRLQAIVRQAGSGILQFSVQKNNLTIVASTVSWELKLPVVSFPSVPDRIEPEASVPSSVLRDAMAATRKAMAVSALRPTLRMLEMSRGKMTACDGVRLAQASLGEGFPQEFSSAVPADAVDLLWGMVKSPQGSIGMSSTASQHVFMSELLTLTVQKLTSKFPNVEQLMLRPALENTHRLVVSRTELLKAIDRAKITADPETSALGVTLSLKSAVISSRDMDGNGSSEVIPSNWTGKDRTLVVSHKYLETLVRSSSSSECRFYLGDDTRSRKSVILMRDDEKGVYGVIPQFSGNVRVF